MEDAVRSTVATQRPRTHTHTRTLHTHAPKIKSIQRHATHARAPRTNLLELDAGAAKKLAGGVRGGCLAEAREQQRVAVGARDELRHVLGALADLEQVVVHQHHPRDGVVVQLGELGFVLFGSGVLRRHRRRRRRRARPRACGCVWACGWVRVGVRAWGVCVCVRVGV
jgi:hypothetical protein